MSERVDRRFEQVRGVWRERGIRGEPARLRVTDADLAGNAGAAVPRLPFYRGNERDAGYERFMRAFGQGENWTLTPAARRPQIVWEPEDQGYWFWMEVPDASPRTGTSLDALAGTVMLSSLEEYVVAWHLSRAIDGRILDRESPCTWSWLRTRCAGGYLSADTGMGQVWITRREAGQRFSRFPRGGGRAVERIPS